MKKLRISGVTGTTKKPTQDGRSVCLVNALWQIVEQNHTHAAKSQKVERCAPALRPDYIEIVKTALGSYSKAMGCESVVKLLQ